MSEEHIAAAKLQKQAYEALSRYMQAHDKQVVEIEVLPPAIQPPDGILIQDGHCLGVPKKVLALAYVEARSRFFANAKSGDSQSLALLATKVILLFDPEHVTAANFRKRRLLQLRSEESPQAQLVFRKALKYEFCFLDSILTSPLHRQSKSPTLWYHRLWILDLLCPDNLQGVPEALRADFWRTELSTVCKSGERHPKNYYAWQYARKLMQRMDDKDTTLDCARYIKTWCCKNPSDVSGWTFLSHLMSRLEQLPAKLDLLREVLDYTIRLQSTHESLWVFIRSVLVHDSLNGVRDEFFALLETQCNGQNIESITGQPSLQYHIQRTLDWVQKNSVTRVST